MSNILVLFPLLIFSVGALAIPALIGVYVYKDAKVRNMDAILWTLVAVLVPGFVGLIIYLVVRNHEVNASCPGCKQPVSHEYALCPYCGYQLKDHCPECNSPVEYGWIVCAKCGNKLPEGHSSVSKNPMSPKNDRTLLWIVLAVIIVPILIFILGVIGLNVYRVETNKQPEVIEQQIELYEGLNEGYDINTEVIR